jgi:hypothetical protein
MLGPAIKPKLIIEAPNNITTGASADRNETFIIPPSQIQKK